jgi:hypothetical protein
MPHMVILKNPKLNEQHNDNDIDCVKNVFKIANDEFRR